MYVQSYHFAMILSTTDVIGNYPIIQYSPHLSLHSPCTQHVQWFYFIFGYLEKLVICIGSFSWALPAVIIVQLHSWKDGFVTKVNVQSQGNKLYIFIPVLLSNIYEYIVHEHTHLKYLNYNTYYSYQEWVHNEMCSYSREHRDLCQVY